MVVVVNTTNTMLAWQDALTLRAQVWALRDFSQSVAVIRKYPKGPAEYPDGLRTQSWSPSAFPFTTGPAMFLTTSYTSLEQQWEWLNRMRAAYLMTYPSVVRGFAKLAEKEGKLPASLRGITTVGEVVDPDLREIAVRFLNAPIHDIYSSEEAGIMALQCPDCTAYHVQSESVIVEVLNANDRPCAPGETGRVVVTPLHNYAMPLLRYEIGDFALAGAIVAFDVAADGCAGDVRIAVFGATDMPRRLVEAEAAIIGTPVDDAAIAAAVEAASRVVEPPSDVHGSAAYRRALLETMLQRALARAAGG